VNLLQNLLHHLTEYDITQNRLLAAFNFFESGGIAECGVGGHTQINTF
jgi:hypothetical protein